MFIGRKEETRKLLDFINDSSSRAAIIYGRRRVGKSELINHVLSMSKKKFIYYECKQTTEKNNVDSIFDLLKEQFNLPSVSFENFESILKYIYSLSIDNELVFVLDEYPYLREVVVGLDSIIQTYINNSKGKKLKIILCGSYIDVMKSLLSHGNPLYGRFDYKLELNPMDYYDSSLFYDEYSYEDKVRIYSVFGGIPYYNKLIDTKRSVRENIIDLIASDGARLENEISIFLKSQLSKLNNANEVFEILSKGFYKYKDIYENANIEKGPTLIDALDKLVSMGLVTKISPINDENNKKKTGYIISDQLSYFYYKYIYNNKSRLKIMNPNYFYDKYINNDFESIFVPKAFETIAKEYLIRINKLGLIETFDNIGKYYYDDPKNHKNGEFDVVTHDDKGYIFYEVKFKNKPLNKIDVYNEINQVKECGIECERFGFISKSGFDFNDETLILIKIEEMFDRSKFN